MSYNSCHNPQTSLNRSSRRASSLFDSSDDVLEFMEDYGFDVARTTLLEQLGRLSEAAELHLAEGRVVRAIELFLRDNVDRSARRRAEECLLDGFWRLLSFGLTVKPDVDLSGSLLDDLLQLSNKMVGRSVLSLKGVDEVSPTAADHIRH